MAKDFAFVCRSLGLSCYLSKQVKRIKETGFSGEYWRASVSGDLSIIPTKDKIFGKRKQKKRTQVHSIQIQDIGEGDYYGFEIDGDRLFLLGDFTVTHNTVLAAYLIQECYKKTKRAIFCVDRINLVDQTSATFDSYGIPHGVMQASHWRHRPWERVQICSIQTLNRKMWPDADLIIVDECHTISKVIKDRLMKRDTIALGLTATPFTRGLGRIYDRIINVTSTQRLIDEGFLSKFRIFACEEPNMEGVRTKAGGEWVESEASGRALEVVGDCVKEYLNYANGRKFICSACDTAHVDALYRQFMDAGIVCANYTYKVSDEERAEIIREFRKPDSYIKGIITVTAATKGFDVPDIGCVIMARPLRKSLAEHIQFLGRGLRPYPGKEECIVLDHSGNCLRFMDEMLGFFKNGQDVLDDGRIKERKKPKEEDDIEDRYRKCPNCRCLHTYAPVCPNCGHEYPPRVAVQHKPGTMRELILSGSRKELTAELWPQIVAYSRRYKAPDKQRGFALAMFKNITQDWPTKDYEETVPAAEISPFVMNKIRQLNIAYAHAMRKSQVEVRA